MRFKCSACSKITSTDNDNIGKTVTCEHCKQEVTVPETIFSPGAVINDFIIKKNAGTGGMGEVYIAHQITLDRTVALKILKEKYAKDKEFINQFIKEARSAARLNHQNIVQAYAVGEENGVFFFAMEFIDGDTMKSILARDGKIDPVKAAGIVKDIAGALDYAWTESKIVHHDIKPDNIMITKNGKAKLADLGLATKFGDTENEDDNEVLGTPQYISPEQLLGELTDVRSDIYSLGATLYHLVTGVFPYTGENVTEIAHQHVNGTFIPPKDRDPSVPGKLSNIITRMMEKNVEQRYQSAADVVKDLLDFIKNPSEPANAPEPPAPAVTGIVSGSDGARKLAIGGKLPMPKAGSAAPAASAAPAPAAVQNKTPVSSKKPVLKPASSAAAPSVVKPVLKPASSGAGKAVAVPNLKKANSASVAVPKLAKPTQVVPKVAVLNDKTPETPAPASSVGAAMPTAVLKPVAVTPAVPPKPEKPEKPENAEKNEKAEKKDASAVKKGEKNSKDGKNSKKSGKSAKSVPAAKQIPGYVKVLIVVGVILLLCGGGIVFYLYKNNWKAPVFDDIAKWNKEREVAARNNAYRVPEKTRKLSIEELRKDYIPEIEKLEKFIADNPSQGKKFIQMVDDFVFDKGRPQLPAEKEPFEKLMQLRTQTEEKVWMEPARASAAAVHNREIAERVRIENERKAQEARIEAARKAEEARAAKAAADAEAARQRAAEEKRRNEELVRAYQVKITPVYLKLANAFNAAIYDDAKVDEFNSMVDNLFEEYRPEGIQMPIFTKLNNFAISLKSELPRTRAAYKLMTSGKGVFKNIIFVVPRYGQVEILDVDFAKHELTVQSTMTEKVRKLSLNDDRVRAKFFEVCIKKLKNVKDINYLPFFYEFCFGDRQKAASMIPAGSKFREFFNNMR